MECVPPDVDEIFVVAALEVDVGQAEQAFVHERRNIVGLTHNGQRAEGAIREDFIDFGLCRKLQTAIDQLVDRVEVEVAARRQDES